MNIDPNILAEKYYKLFEYSNPTTAQHQAEKWLGKGTILYPSYKKDKKYMVQRPDGKWVHFGQIGYEDYLKHQNEDRRRRYRLRATNMKGNWKDDKYSPNNLSIHILW